MSSRNLFASILMTCLLAAGLFGFAPAANAATAGQMFLNADKAAGNPVIPVKRHVKHRRSTHKYTPPPIAPAYIYYDYPYYFSRGHYPTHIGRGFVYYAPPYDYRRGYPSRFGGICSKYPGRCAIE